MKPAQKQTALKAGLFMILAANVGGHVHPQTAHVFQVTELASELGTSHGTVPSRTGGGPSAPSDDSVIKVEAPPSAPPVGPRPDAPIAGANADAKESNEYPSFCAVGFKIHFVQANEAGKDVVHAYVTKRFTNETYPGLVEDGTFRDLIANASSKAQWDSKIKGAVEAKLKAEGVACDSQVSTSTPVVPSTNSDEASERIARGVRNCALDADGNALKSPQRFTCNLKRLQTISLDKSAMDDDDAQDEKLRRTRARRSQQDGLEAVESALRPLENSIKSLLLSSKQENQDDGADHLADVLSALRDIRETATRTTDERAMTRLIDGLEKAYPLGAKVSHEADQFASKLGAIDNNVNDLRTSMAGANMYQQQAINQQLQFLQSERMATLQAVNSNSDYLKFRAICQPNAFLQTDCADFTSSYNQLLQQLQGANASSLSNGFLAAPTDILNVRHQAATTDPRSYGLQNPTFPQINYQLLGLQNPSLVGGTNPVFSTSPQQQSVFGPQQQSVFGPQQQSVFPNSNTLSNVRGPAVPGRI